jgi:hypothetical protein
MSATATTIAAEWTCSRCQVTSRWLAGSEPHEHPPHWAEEDGDLYCLGCRRALAAEAGFANAPADVTREQRVKLRTEALVEFEIERDPERPNGEIAKIARCSVPAVLKVRRRLQA